MLNLSIILEESSKRYPDKPAFTYNDRLISYKQTNEAVNRLANGLTNLGIVPGDKIALTCLNLPEFPIIYFAIIRMGAIVVPLNVLLKKDEIEYHLRDSDAKAYICYEGSSEIPMAKAGRAAFDAVETCQHFITISANPDAADITGTLSDLMEGQSPVFEIFPSNAEDSCVIIYTSGTTGRPKGAELTHSNLIFNAIFFCDLIATKSTDVLLVVLPLFHIFGMTAMMNAGVYRGCSHILLPRFDAAVAYELLHKHRVTVFAGVPTMYWGLLHYTHPQLEDANIKASLRYCISGGASLPLTVIEAFEQRFGIPITEGYGMSEGSPAVTFNQLAIGRKPGSVGTPIWGVDVKLVNTDGIEVPVGEKGELLYRGPNVMKGYYKKPEETAKTLKNGWLHSGDIAVKDADGFYYIVDRTKDMINRAGYKVYPREVEEVMMQHEAVSMLAVIGIPHEEFGEEVKAFVVLKPGKSIAENELISWTRERLASYKYPRYIEFVSSLPISATGKILKKELRQS
jgi:long-chain acyl-CoA synthetase